MNRRLKTFLYTAKIKIKNHNIYAALVKIEMCIVEYDYNIQCVFFPVRFRIGGRDD